MNFFVPDIGTMLILNQDWTVTMFYEHRNFKMLDHLFKRKEIDNPKINQIVVLPKKLVLKIDRIYIKKGLSQYSSITFSVPKPKNKMDKKEMPINLDYYGNKFWIKLHECNGIDIDPYHGNFETHDLVNLLYKEIEGDMIKKFGVEKCTKLMSSINKLLGPGQNIANLKTHLTFDQFLSSMISKIKEEDFMSNYLQSKIKSRIRDFKIKKLIAN